MTESLRIHIAALIADEDGWDKDVFSHPCGDVMMIQRKRFQVLLRGTSLKAFGEAIGRTNSLPMCGAAIGTILVEGGDSDWPHQAIRCTLCYSKLPWNEFFIDPTEIPIEMLDASGQKLFPETDLEALLENATIIEPCRANS